jgi:hypothetical protein
MELIHIPTLTVIHKVDDGAGRALLLAMPEAFKRTELPTFNVQQKSNPAAPRWCVQKNPWSDRMEICVTVLNRSIRYPGLDCVQPTIEEAKTALEAATGHPVPAHILEEFAAVQRPAIDPDVITEARGRLQDAQYARESAERLAERKAGLLG